MSKTFKNFEEDELICNFGYMVEHKDKVAIGLKHLNKNVAFALIKDPSKIKIIIKEYDFRKINIKFILETIIRNIENYIENYIEPIFGITFNFHRIENFNEEVSSLFPKNKLKNVTFKHNLPPGDYRDYVLKFKNDLIDDIDNHLLRIKRGSCKVEKVKFKNCYIYLSLFMKEKYPNFSFKKCKMCGLENKIFELVRKIFKGEVIINSETLKDLENIIVDGYYSRLNPSFKNAIENINDEKAIKAVEILAKIHNYCTSYDTIFYFEQGTKKFESALKFYTEIKKIKFREVELEDEELTLFE